MPEGWFVGETAGATSVGSPSFVALTSAPASAFVTSTSITIPAAASVGDALVLTAMMRGTRTFLTPAGWTLANSYNDGITELRAWYRVCQAGDAGSTVTISISGGTEIPNVACLVYTGTDPVSPLFAVFQQFGGPGTTPWDAGRVAVSPTADTACVLIWASWPNGSDPLTFPTGTTGRLDVNISTARILAVADEVIAAGGSEPIRSATPAFANSYVALDLALVAPSAPGGFEGWS